MNKNLCVIFIIILVILVLLYKNKENFSCCNDNLIARKKNEKSDVKTIS